MPPRQSAAPCCASQPLPRCCWRRARRITSVWADNLRAPGSGFSPVGGSRACGWTTCVRLDHLNASSRWSNRTHVVQRDRGGPLRSVQLYAPAPACYCRLLPRHARTSLPPPRQSATAALVLRGRITNSWADHLRVDGQPVCAQGRLLFCQWITCVRLDHSRAGGSPECVIQVVQPHARCPTALK